MALLWIFSKEHVYFVDYEEGKIVANTKEKIPQASPSIYTTVWAINQKTKELITFDESAQNFNIYDMKRGELMDTIKTGWEKKGTHMLASSDGSIILSVETDDQDWEKAYPLEVFDTVKRKKVNEIKLNKRLDFRPEVTQITEDGKYFFCCDDNYHICVYNTLEGKQIATLKRMEDDEDTGNSQVNALVASSIGGYVLVCFYTTVYIGDDYITQSIITAYELDTWERKAEIVASGMIHRFYLSHDTMRVMSDVRPGAGQMKTLDLYDLSKFKSDGQITKIACLKLETDARFSYLSKDGKTVILGLANVDGLTFFQPCGTEPVIPKQDDIIELSDDVEDYEKRSQ